MLLYPMVSSPAKIAHMWYFENYERLKEGRSQEETIWAVNLIDKLILKDPEKALEIALELIKNSEDDDTLAFIAAGPLEDLIVYNGKK